MHLRRRRVVQCKSCVLLSSWLHAVTISIIERYADAVEQEIHMMVQHTYDSDFLSSQGLGDFFLAYVNNTSSTFINVAHGSYQERCSFLVGSECSRWERKCSGSRRQHSNGNEEVDSDSVHCKHNNPYCGWLCVRSSDVYCLLLMNVVTRCAVAPRYALVLATS